MPNRLLFVLITILLGIAVNCFADDASLSDLQARAEAALATAKAQNVDMLAPKSFSVAQSAYDDAKSLIAKLKPVKQISDKLTLCLSNLEEANKIAAQAHAKLDPSLKARSAALEQGSDTLKLDSWTRGEKSLKDAIRVVEKGRDIKSKEQDDIVGSYRAARLEALRKYKLGQVKSLIAAARNRNAMETTPTLLLRAEQAVSRAEAALMQDDLNKANTEAKVAMLNAKHALSMLDYIDAAKKQQNSWESAILPYDDLLASLVEKLHGDLDLSQSGIKLGPPILALVDQRQESLATQNEKLQSNLKETRDNLEGSLSEAQTNLTDARNKIDDLEKRLSASEADRKVVTEAAQKRAQFAERMARAQGFFEPGEAVVLQDSTGHIIIRIQGLAFASGVTTISKEQAKLLDKVKEAVLVFPKYAIAVEGHSDAQGNAAKLQELSESRAKSVAEFLTQSLKLDSIAISVKGFGSTRPIASNDTKEGRTKNRRVDVVLTAKD